MRSYHIEQAGSIEHLVCREHEVPVPGPRQVQLRIRANSINSRDYSMLLGQYTLKPRAGLIPLCDGAGEVTAVGPGVTRFALGDRVAPIFHQGWLAGPRTPEVPRGDLGGTLDGLLTEYAVIDEQGLVRIPANLSFAEAATLPAAAVTAWNALLAQGPLLPGQTVLVQGTGGVAVFAAQLARLAGARVVALSSSKAKLARMQALGAEVLVNYVENPDWHQEVLRLTGGRGVDLAVEVVGNLDKTFRATRIGGQISFVGRLGNSDATASLVPIQLRNLRMVGVGVGSRADFENLVRAIEAHDLHPVIHQCFPFPEARAAFRAFGERQFVGKIVIEHD
ncbi:MAG TPA: NAD(P)-dependent alcohol dehydrogenase [Ramlibacter sp.]|nr:NAD(P)-dependent alcohol dehydrogenase [Ramlibacter sp.]